MRRDRELEKLIAHAAPELAGTTAVLIDLPPHLIADDCDGFAMPHPAQPLIDADPSIEGCRIIGLSRQVAELGRLATVIHEATHLLPAKPVSQPPCAAASAIAAAMFAHWAASSEPPRTYARPWEEDHGPRFIRVAIHLFHRLARWLPPWARVNDVLPQHYGLSQLTEYAKRLGDEPERCCGLTFAEIEATEPPAAFTKLFDSDVLAYETKEKDHADVN